MNSRSNSNKFAIERMPQPRTLKEFLKDDDSCSSSGFKSLPRRLPHSDHNPPPLQRSRSRSRAAAEAAISSVQKLLKSLHLITSSPPPETLSRSFSKRLFRWSSSSSAKKKKKNSPEFNRRHSSSSEGNNYNKVKVKDILKWRSFRDVAVDAAAEAEAEVEAEEVKSAQLESEEAARARSESESGSSGSGSGCGSGSGSGNGGEGWWRWGGDSENSFTAAELPGGNNCLLEGEEGKSGKCNKSNNYADVDGGGGDLVRGTTEATESATVEDNVTSEEEKEQLSPVSVLNSPFRDETSDEELVSSFDQSLANVEKTKQRLLERIKWLESLAGGDDDQSSVEDEDEDEHSETDEVEEERQQQQVPRKEDIAIEKTKNRVYLSRELGKLRAGQNLKDIEVFIKDMERQGQWSKFGEEREEIGVEMEVCLLNDLVDEVMGDFFG